MSTNTIQDPTNVSDRIWNYASVLRDDGVGYGDYLEQLTYLIFLKLAYEFSQKPGSQFAHIPEEYAWPTLTAPGMAGAALETQYVTILQKLGERTDIIGNIFTKAQNRIQDPAKLARVIRLVDAEEWSTMHEDVKGEIYESLLERNAQDVKSGAGQYFTPRPLIRAIVACVDPKPNRTICDPAAGTGGFLLAAAKHIESRTLDGDAARFLKERTFFGNEIVANTRRLCLMNMVLHNIGESTTGPPITTADALLGDDRGPYDYVLTNPPFGRKSSMTFTNEESDRETEDLTVNRADFWVTTSNKQINFVQHVRSILKTTGTAAVVVPDNVLFEAGAGETVRRKLLDLTNLHTILRLPTGIFYRPGVKANVIFFDNRPAGPDPHTNEVWYYDLRTNMHFTLKKNPLTDGDLKEFVELYKGDESGVRRETWSEENSEGRWRRYTREDILGRDGTSLDIFWIRDRSLTDLDDLPSPEIIAAELAESLENAAGEVRDIVAELEALGLGEMSVEHDG